MRNLLRNNRGFTLLEILVTVGIVGVLSAVAVPAYNQYKKGTIETAVESDIGNFQKAYMAYNAVNGTYCASFVVAGIQMRDPRNYNKSGIIGFSDVDASCGGTPDEADVQASGEDGSCADAKNGATPPVLLTPQPTTAAACAAAPTAGTWTGTAAGTLANCDLDIDQFKMGAATNVSGIEKIWAINEEGKIGEATGTALAGKADCTNIDVVADAKWN